MITVLPVGGASDGMALLVVSCLYVYMLTVKQEELKPQCHQKVGYRTLVDLFCEITISLKIYPITLKA